MKLSTEKAIKQKFGNPKAIKKLTQPLKTIPCFHIVENEIDKEIIQMNKWKDGVDAVLLGYCIIGAIAALLLAVALWTYSEERLKEKSLFWRRTENVRKIGGNRFYDAG